MFEHIQETIRDAKSKLTIGSKRFRLEFTVASDTITVSGTVEFADNTVINYDNMVIPYV